MTDTPTVRPGQMFFTTKEVANLLNCHMRTVQMYAESGTLPHIKLGRMLRFPCDEILGKIDDLRRDSAD